MAKFEKATSQQAKFKAGLYGKQGSGKTFTSLLIAEGLAKRENKRIAYIDTERGTEFYAMHIPERDLHPAAFDFDRIVTRSITETLEAVRELDTAVYGVLVIDSITHLWEAAREAYNGKRMSNGGIPIQAWGQIKKPYKGLMTEFLDGNYHAIMCGREGVEMEDDEDGEAKVVGSKMKAEGETAYEPHILIRMRPEKILNQAPVTQAFFEKDRSGILTGRTVSNPGYSTVEPIVRYLSGDTQGKIGSLAEAAERDADAIDKEKERASNERRNTFESIRNAILQSVSVDSLRAAWDLTRGKKTKLGEELYAQLETEKEARKRQLMEAA